MAAATNRKNILVVGATGKQGGSAVKALLAMPRAEPPLHILAVTRNPESAAAKALAAAHPDTVTLVTGDLSNSKSIFATQPKGTIAAAFLVTVPGSDEEAQARPFIDAAIEHGVPHIVFTSVERGGDAKSWDNPTDVPHFFQKHRAELYLRDKAKEAGNVTWTILRPVAFFDNLNPGSFAGVMVAMWATALSPDRKLQHVAVRDIGIFAAKALTDPARWAGRAIGLAGDELTLGEAKERFKKVTGKPLPQSWGVLGRMVLWFVGDVRKMFGFFEKEGYGVDIEALRKEAGSDGLWDFEAWLREGSKWEVQK